MRIQYLITTWAKRTPNFETCYLETIFKEFTNYGGGSERKKELNAKEFKSGLEIYIYAFFLGLYKDIKTPLKENVSNFGQPICRWGNVSQFKGREDYSRIQKYIFAALVAKTDDLDFLELEKGEISDRKAVSALIKTMEEYANTGFQIIEEEYNNDRSRLHQNEGFLQLLLENCPKPIPKEESFFDVADSSLEY